MSAPRSRRIDGQHIRSGEIRSGQLLKDARLSHDPVGALNVVVVDPTTKNDLVTLALRGFD